MLVQDLEAKGYVRREPDPAVRRAAIVCFTDDGERILRDAYVVKQEIEGEYRAQLGDAGFDQLLALLSRLLDGASPAPVVRYADTG